MKRGLVGFVEKLKSFSKALDNSAILIDQPWVTSLDGTNERCVFIFRESGNQLLISQNGRVQKGSWDYIPSMNSLLIEWGNETILYNQGFLDESVMMLRVDGASDFQVFLNENKITTDVEKALDALENKYLSAGRPQAVDQEFTRIVKMLSKDGDEIKIYTTLDNGYKIGDKIMVNGKTPKDGTIKLSWLQSIKIRDGRINWM